MKRWMFIAAPVAILIVVAAAALSWNGGCASAYDISVEITPSGTAGYPYVAKGTILGCGIYAISGRSEFQLMLSPSVTSISRADHGRAIVEARAGISAEDSRKAWYVVTVEKNSTVVASKRDVLVVRP